MLGLPIHQTYRHRKFHRHRFVLPAQEGISPPRSPKTEVRRVQSSTKTEVRRVQSSTKTDVRLVQRSVLYEDRRATYEDQSTKITDQSPKITELKGGRFRTEESIVLESQHEDRRASLLVPTPGPVRNQSSRRTEERSVQPDAPTSPESVL